MEIFSRRQCFKFLMKQSKDLKVMINVIKMRVIDGAFKMNVKIGDYQGEM